MPISRMAEMSDERRALPYRVIVEKAMLFSADQDVSVSIVFRNGQSAEAEEDADTIFTGFLHLARSGALAGARIPPPVSGIEGVAFEGWADNRATWRLRRARIDEGAVWSLVQMFRLTHRAWPIERISLRGPSNGEAAPLASAECDTYPEVFAARRRVTELAPPMSGSLALEAEFTRQLQAEECRALRVRIEDWIAASAMGFYAVPGSEPDACSVQYDGRIDIVPAALFLSLQRFLCNPAAVFGLANCILSIESDDLAVSRLSVS